MSKESNAFWAQYQKDYAHIDMGAMLDAYVEECKNNDPFYTPRIKLHLRISELNAQVADVTKTLGIAQGKIGELNNDWTEIVAAKDAAIDSLTFQLSEANRVLEAHKVVAASRSENIAALKADNARMEKGIRDIHAKMKNHLGYKTPEHRWGIIEHLGLLLSPADAPLPECLCSHTIDGRLVKQCDNCRNKPFAPADGVLVSTKPDIETQQEDVMVVGNCANCGVEFHIHKQDSPADGDGVEETPKVDLAYSAFRHAVSALYFSDSADYPRKLYQIIIDYKRLTDGVSDYLLTEYFYETHPECAIDRHKEEL